MSVLITAALAGGAAACGASRLRAGPLSLRRNTTFSNFASPDRAPGPLSVDAAD